MTIAIISLGLIDAQIPQNDQPFAWTSQYNFQAQAVTPYEDIQSPVEDRDNIDAVTSNQNLENSQMRPVTA